MNKKWETDRITKYYRYPLKIEKNLFYIYIADETKRLEICVSNNASNSFIEQAFLDISYPKYFYNLEKLANIVEQRCEKLQKMAIFS